MPRTSKPSAITSYARKATQRRSHGQNARCKRCGETDPARLIHSRPKLCEECFRKHRGAAAKDDHHPAGRANSSYTVALPANMHRSLTDAQNDWDTQTLENPQRCPVRRGAASIRGYAETCKEMIDYLVLWVAKMLEHLSDWLFAERGADWWIGTPLERWATNA